jgi:transposase
VPAENNRAERELRPTVIARKVSFGSQSDRGCKTRSAIMSVLLTAKKRFPEKPPEVWLKEILDRIATHPKAGAEPLLHALA